MNNTSIVNYKDFVIHEDIYEKLHNNVSDLVSLSYDLGRYIISLLNLTNNQIEQYNREYIQATIDSSISVYAKKTLEDNNTELYYILSNFIKSYNKIIESPNTYNTSEYIQKYPKLNINYNTLFTHYFAGELENLITIFSLYYHPEQNSRYSNRETTKNRYFPNAVFHFVNNIYYIDFNLSKTILETIENKLPEIDKNIIKEVTQPLEPLDPSNYNPPEHFSGTNIPNYPNEPPQNNMNNYFNYNAINNRNNNNYNNNVNNNNNNRNNNLVQYNNKNNTNFNIKNVPNLGKGAEYNKCFNPIMVNTENITSEMTLFYIEDKNGKISEIGCLDEDSLESYKNNKKDYVYHQCTPNTNAKTGGLPMTSTYVSRNQLIGKPLFKFNFQTSIYILLSDFNKLKKGKAYILEPTNKELGRIASDTFLRTENVVSADHCQTIFKDPIYKVSEAFTHKQMQNRMRSFFSTNNNMNGGSKTRKAKKIKKGGYRPTKKNLKYLRLYKQGKSIGFTMRSSLKAKGLIPRSNGTYRVSAKYMKKVRK